MKTIARLAVILSISAGSSFASSPLQSTCNDIYNNITAMLLTLNRYENRSVNLDASMALIEHLYFQTQKTSLKELVDQFHQSDCSFLFKEEQ